MSCNQDAAEDELSEIAICLPPPLPLPLTPPLMHSWRGAVPGPAAPAHHGPSSTVLP